MKVLSLGEVQQVAGGSLSKEIELGVSSSLVGLGASLVLQCLFANPASIGAKVVLTAAAAAGSRVFEYAMREGYFRSFLTS